MNSNPLLKVLLLASVFSATPLYPAAPKEAINTLKGLPGVRVVVEAIDEEARDHGLTEESIKTAVESRLRQSGIRLLSNEEARTPKSGWSYLYVLIHTLDVRQGEFVFNVNLSFFQAVQLVRDPSIVTLAATWDTDMTMGMRPAQEIRGIRDSVLSMVGDFITAYKSVNAKH